MSAEHMELHAVELQKAVRLLGKVEQDVTALTVDELRDAFNATHDLSRHVFWEEWRRTHAPRLTRTHRKLMRRRYYKRRWCRDAWTEARDWHAAGPNSGMYTVAMARWAGRLA